MSDTSSVPSPGVEAAAAIDESEAGRTPGRLRARLSRPAAFWLVGVVLGFLLFAASAPSPIYVIYQARWHFSPTTLTAVFAVYALAVLVALIVFGSLSDHVGRRPVLIGALLLEALSMALFAAATGVTWLFVARVLQGLATGAATSAISATLIDLQPPRRPRLGALVNTISPSAGLAAGALGAGALVQYAPAPTRLVYLVLLGVFVVAAAGALALPETVAQTATGWREALRPRRVAVPGELRRAFAIVSASIVAAWAIGGLYLSLGPSLAAGLLHTRSHLLGGLVIFALAGVGALAQLALSGWESRRAMVTGSLAMIVGLALVVYALSPGSTAIFFAGSVVLGFGFGIAFMGAFRTLSALTAPEHRAEVIAAIYVVAYLAMSLPAIAAGLAVSHLGLHTTTVIYASVVAVLAAVAAAGAAVGHLTIATEHQPERNRDLVAGAHLGCPSACTVPGPDVLALRDDRPVAPEAHAAMKSEPAASSTALIANREKHR